MLYEFGIVDPEWMRLALTWEQVHDPALDIERLAIAVKPSDSRTRAYVERYGNRCWEADILPPEIIEGALGAHIAGWFDGRLWRRHDAEIERARGLL